MIGPAVVAAAAIYGLIGVGGAVVLSWSRNVELKRRILPWYLGLSSISFLAFIAALGFGVLGVGMMAVVVVAIAALDHSRIGFCEKCGRTSWGSYPARADVSCRECGAPLSTMGDATKG